MAFVLDTMPLQKLRSSAEPLLQQLPEELGSAAAFYSRFVVVQAVGAAAIVGLSLAGVANKPFEGNNAPLCWLIVAVGLLGLGCVFVQRWADAKWIATHVVRLGLLGTVVGLII